MDMETLNVHDIQTNLSSVLEMMEKEGKSFLILRDGQPVADLVPHTTHFADDEDQVEEKGALQKLSCLVREGIGIPPSKELRKSSVPTISVKGKPLSQMIIEDRR